MSADVRSALRRIREILQMIWKQASPFVRRRFAYVLLLVFGAALLAPLGPVALKMIVDTFTRDASFTPAAIAVPIVLYVASQWLSRSIGEIRGLVYARAERRMFTHISDHVFGHVLKLPFRFHLQRATGAINQTLENGLQGYQLIVHHLAFTALPVIAQLATTAWILFRIDQPVFLLIFCAAVVCYGVAFGYFVLHVTRAAELAASANVEARALMNDTLLNYETVKFYTAEPIVRHRVQEALTVTEQRWMQFYRGYAANGLVVAAIFATFLATAVVLAVREVSTGNMTIGEFVLINAYMLQLTQPVEMLGFAVQGFSQGGAMLEKMLALLREEREEEAVPQTERRLGGEPAPGQTPAHVAVGPAALAFRNVSTSYRPDRPVLHDVSFAVPAGRTLGVVGASGSGKSTLVRLLTRLLEPDAGTVLLDGTPVLDRTRDEVRRAIAVVPQDTVLFNDTIGYNIGIGRAGCTQEEIERAARLAHLHELIMTLPDRYDTKVGERGVQLSGGERQRVSIARAALKQPRIYVFDEATASLDSRTEQEIMINLRALARATTTLIIAHRLSTVVHADEIVVLRSGEIVERGTHHELLGLNGTYAGLWNAQHGNNDKLIEHWQRALHRH